jgi:hypothetical protein
MKHTPQTKEKIRQSMLRRNLSKVPPPHRSAEQKPDGQEKRAALGIAKAAGINIGFDSEWEKLLADRLDSINVKWVRPQFGFPYYWKNKLHHYYPDFYLPHHGLFIEVKGYYTAVDFAKFSYFPHPLIVIYSIKTINSFVPGKCA